MFSVHTPPDELKHASNTDQTPIKHRIKHELKHASNTDQTPIKHRIKHRSIWTWSGESRDYRHCFRIDDDDDVFRPYKNKKAAFSNFPALKSVYEKLRLGDGFLSLDGGPNRRYKAPFSFDFYCV